MIVGVAELPEEEPEVILLGEAGQLGDVVQPDVEYALNVSAAQEGEELLGALPGKSDCEQLNHRVVFLPHRSGSLMNHAGILR